MIDYFTSNLLSLPQEEEFRRIKGGESISSINIPYTTEYIKKLIEYFELVEEYEKCQFLLGYKINRESHVEKFSLDGIQG